MSTRLAELWIILNADRKKSAVLGVLLLALTLLGLRTVLSGGIGSAQARDRRAAGQPDAAPAAGLAAAAAAAAAGRPIIRVPRPAELTRNLFLVNEVTFPRPVEMPQSAGVAQKSQSETAEDPEVVRGRERAAAEKRVREQASKLRLRSTMLGRTPMAVVDQVGRSDRRNFVLRPGESVDGLTLVEVSELSVVLEKDGFRVELKRELPER
ncbi:MAG: hypothetical protein IBJ11_02010 [Phycisphaerales bacterium]|nr:hypothetical protein [Phycisphaerales bacterium]